VCIFNRRALLYLSEEADTQTAHRFKSVGLEETLAATQAELTNERALRTQADRELERALGLLKANVAQRLSEQNSTRHTQEWKESFLDASRQNKALNEGLQQQEMRLREEMRGQQEAARQKYAHAIDQLRSLEGEVKKEGAHKLVLEQEMSSCKQQLATQQEQNRAEVARLQQTGLENQRSSNEHHEQLIACRSKLELSEQALLTLRSQMEDISCKLQDAVYAYEERRSKIHTQKSTIKEITARLEEEVEARQVLSHEMDTASAEIVKLRMLVDELNVRNESLQKTHDEQMGILCASVEADRSQFGSLRAMVEQRYDDERAQRSTAEIALLQQMAQLKKEVQEAEGGREEVQVLLSSANLSLRKASSQLLSLGQRREQEVSQALVVEQALRCEVAKLAESALLRQRQTDNRERENEVTLATRVKEREASKAEAVTLREALARIEHSGILLRTQVVELQEKLLCVETARVRDCEETARESTRDKERLREWTRERDREEERKLRSLEQSFVAMFEEAITSSLAPILEDAVQGVRHVDGAGADGDATPLPGSRSLAQLSASHIVSAHTPPHRISSTHDVSEVRLLTHTKIHTHMSDVRLLLSAADAARDAKNGHGGGGVRGGSHRRISGEATCSPMQVQVKSTVMIHPACISKLAFQIFYPCTCASLRRTCQKSACYSVLRTNVITCHHND